MDLRDVVKIIRGKKGTVVKLTILREATEKNKQPILIIPITRDEIKLQDKEAKSELFIFKKDNKEIKIGYIKLPTFYLDFDAVKENDPKGKSSSRDMINQINSLLGSVSNAAKTADSSAKKIDGMVIDLRGNPGGLVTAAVDVASQFFPENTLLFVEKSGTAADNSYFTHSGGLAVGTPLVVLVDSGSASAAEIVSGAIQDHNRGKLVGTVTYGKGSVQEWIPLQDNMGAVRITVALWYTPNGRQISEKGLTPDVPVTLTEAEHQAGKDPQLDKAVELLS